MLHYDLALCGYVFGTLLLDTTKSAFNKGGKINYFNMHLMPINLILFKVMFQSRLNLTRIFQVLINKVDDENLLLTCYKSDQYYDASNVIQKLLSDPTFQCTRHQTNKKLLLSGNLLDEIRSAARTYEVLDFNVFLCSGFKNVIILLSEEMLILHFSSL